MTMPDFAPLVTDENVEPWTGPTVPVHIESAKASWGKTTAPEFAGCNTWSLNELGVANAGANATMVLPGGIVQIANRQYTRYEFRFWIYQLSGQSATFVCLNSDMNQCSQGIGMLIPAAMLPFGGGGGAVWRSQRELYAVGIGGTATVIGIDEIYAQIRKTLRQTEEE